jgi:hypothetical protein
VVQRLRNHEQEQPHRHAQHGQGHRDLSRRHGDPLVAGPLEAQDQRGECAAMPG